MALPGLTDGRDGSNVSMTSTGVVAREPSDVTRWEFALESQGINRDQTTKRRKSSLHRLPVQVRHLCTGGVVDECAAGLCYDRPDEGLRGLMFTGRDDGLRRLIHRRKA